MPGDRDGEPRPQDAGRRAGPGAQDGAAPEAEPRDQDLGRDEAELIGEAEPPEEPEDEQEAAEPQPAGPPPSQPSFSSEPSFEIDPVDLEALPARYAVRQDGELRYLACVEAPTISVHVDKGVTVPANAARKSPPGTIFLDGAASGEPFTDDRKSVYNLDHHEGCVRAFTLSACEQAMVMVTKGLDLGRGEWRVHANEPDLDTVLAIWVLLNHVRLSAGEAVRRAIMPLVRLEGAIDAHGLAGRGLVAFPDELLEETTRKIDALRREESELKDSGLWSSTDYLEYTARALARIDEMVYSPEDFEGFQSVEELARVELGGERIAVVCTSSSGIYEVEQALKRLHGARVGLIVLQKDPSNYTIRLVDAFMPVKLEPLYERLNLADPSVTGGSARNRWGGSSEIGGSPRSGGTALGPQAIARIIRWVYQPASPLQKLRQVGIGLGLTAAYLVAASLLVWLVGSPPPGAEGLARAAAEVRQGWVSAAMFLLAALPFLAFGLRDRRRFGLRLPAGPWFLAGVPIAVAAGVLGGAAFTAPGEGVGADLLVPAVLLPCAAEVLFRGLVHGLLFEDFRVQRAGGRWFVSVPTALTAALSAAVTGLLLVPLVAHTEAASVLAPIGVVAALVLGLLCGVARERGESLLAPVVLHVSAGLSATLLPSLFG